MQGCDKNANINVQQCSDLTPVHKKGGFGLSDYYNDTDKKIAKFHYTMTDFSTKVDEILYGVLLRSVFLGIPSGLSWEYIGTELSDDNLEEVKELQELPEFTDVTAPEFQALSEDDRISKMKFTIEEKDLLEKLDFDNYITYDCYVAKGKSFFRPTGRPVFSSRRLNTIIAFHIKEDQRKEYEKQEAIDQSTTDERAEKFCNMSYELQDDIARSCTYDSVKNKCYAKNACELNLPQLEIQGKCALVTEFTSEYIGITLKGLRGIVLSPPYPFDSTQKMVAMAFAFENLDEEHQNKLLTATDEKNQDYPIANGIFIVLDVPLALLSDIEPVKPPVWELMPSDADVSFLTSYDPQRVTERQNLGRLLESLGSATDTQHIVIDPSSWSDWNITTTMENTFVTAANGQMYRTKPIQLIPWPLIHVSNAIKKIRSRYVKGGAESENRTRILHVQEMVDFWETLHDNSVGSTLKQVQKNAERAVRDILYRAQKRVIELSIIDGRNWEFVSTNNKDPGGRNLAMHLKKYATLLAHLKKDSHVSNEILHQSGTPDRFVFDRNDYLYADKEAGYWRPIGDVTEEPNNGNDKEYVRCKEQLKTIISKGTLTVDVDGSPVEVKLVPGKPAENFILRVYDQMWNILGSVSSGKKTKEDRSFIEKIKALDSFGLMFENKEDIISSFTKNTESQNTRRKRESLSVLPKALNLLPNDEVDVKEDLDVDKIITPGSQEEFIVADAPSASPQVVFKQPSDKDATSDLKTYPVMLGKTHMDSLGLEFVRRTQDADGNAVFEYKSKPPFAPTSSATETTGAKSAEEYTFAQPPPGVIIPSMSSETHVTIKPRGNGLADVIVARPRSREPPATQVRSTNEQGEYECAMRFVDRKYKCWDKMSDIASVTLTTYRWIARNVIDFYKLHDKTSLVIYHASNTPDVFPPNDQAHVVLVGAVETTRELAATLRSDQTAVLVKTVCGANDKMPCVDASCTLSNTECVQCRHDTFCGADESVLLALVVWACERRPTPITVELRGIPERLYKLAKWLCDISTPRADVMNFENGVRAQLHIQRFIESVPLCLSSTTQKGMCYWFDPHPSPNVTQWMNESNLSYVAPQPPDPHEAFIKDWMKATQVDDILSPNGLASCSDPEFLNKIRCVLKKIKTLHQRIIDKRTDAERFLNTQKLIPPTRFEELKRRADNPRTPSEETVYNVYVLKELYSRVNMQQVCSHLDDTDLSILTSAVDDRSLSTMLDDGERLHLLEIGKFMPHLTRTRQ